MPEPILRGDAGRKLATQSRELPCSPAGRLIRTFVRKEYTPTSFQSQAALFAEFAEVGETGVGRNHPTSANLRIPSASSVSVEDRRQERRSLATSRLTITDRGKRASTLSDTRKQAQAVAPSFTGSAARPCGNSVTPILSRVGPSGSTREEARPRCSCPSTPPAWNRPACTEGTPKETPRGCLAWNVEICRSRTIPEGIPFDRPITAGGLVATGNLGRQEFE